MSKKTAAVVATATVVLASIALGTALAHRAAKLAQPKPGEREPLPLAMVCEQKVVYDESCSFGSPKKLGDPVTSTCSFTIDCCGAVAQKWTKSFTSDEGRGRFGHIQQQLSYSCKASPNDVDQDGIANYDDEFPAEPDPASVVVLHVPAPAATESATPTPTPAPTAEPAGTPYLIGNVDSAE